MCFFFKLSAALVQGQPFSEEVLGIQDLQSMLIRWLPKGRRYRQSGWSPEGSVDHEPFFFEHHVQVVHGPIDFALLLRSGANELPRGEEKYDGLGVWHPVDQTGELLRLVHRFW